MSDQESYASIAFGVYSRELMFRSVEQELNDALRAERQAERDAQALHALVRNLRAQMWLAETVTMVASVASVIVAIALLFAALPAYAEPATLTAARTAQLTCVQREYRTRTASAGVSATEAALVARAQAEHACALEAWSRALGAAAEVRVVTATRALVLVERVGDTAYVSADRGLTWREVLSHGGACALCGGGVALGAWAACGGVR